MCFGVSNTFNSKNHPSFYSGGISFSEDECDSINVYNNQGPQTTNFFEVLLADGASNIVYTAILEIDTLGFDSETHDFQMIVGEDGHEGDVDTSDYYFYLEID